MLLEKLQDSLRMETEVQSIESNNINIDFDPQTQVEKLQKDVEN